MDASLRMLMSPQGPSEASILQLIGFSGSEQSGWLDRTGGLWGSGGNRSPDQGHPGLDSIVPGGSNSCLLPS
jgi:hypothetical protein